jgi:hypothetical protein
MATRDPDFPLIPHYTQPHVKVAWSGTSGQGAGNELWVMGVKVGKTQAGSATLVPPLQEDVDQIAAEANTAMTAFISAGAGPTALFSDDVSYTACKATAIGTNNLLDPTLKTKFVDPPAPVRGKANPTAENPVEGRLPYAVSIAVTLLGDRFARGPGTYGRFYLPMPNIHANTASAGPSLPLVDGLMQAGTVTAFAGQAANLITGLKSVAASQNGFYYGVFNISVSKVGLAESRFCPIIHVTVDSRPDTVRRRQNKIGGRGKVGNPVATW